MNYSLILLVVGAVFLGSLTRSTFGFGDAVVSMPLLALLPIPYSEAVALVGLVGFTVALFFAFSGWKDKDSAVLKQMSLATLLGIPFGLLLIRFASQRWISLFLGLLLIAYALYSLLGPKAHQRSIQKTFENNYYSIPFGFASGMLGSAYNLNGTPIVLYATLRNWSPIAFRGNVQSHFIISSSFILISHFLSGFWTIEVGVYYLFSIPAVLGAIWIGNFIYGKIDTENFKKYVFYSIFVL
ncbi:sulfite exporter TauE/SafE family protein, partial [Alkalibacterium iburiense]|uniref:sulfite exporter TauE/SafE family protein n=1 Tax=Alkalibacterium iburiense TaxID=290589 RepID=UPI0031D1FDD4